MRNPLSQKIAASAFTFMVICSASAFTTSTVKYQPRFKTNMTESDSNGQPNSKLKHIEFGLRYMPTFTNLELQNRDGDVIESSGSFSNGFGAMLGFNITNHIGIQAEASFYSASQKYTEGGYDQNVKIKYINIPLFFSLNTNKTSRFNLNLVAGPQFGVNAGSKISSGGSGSKDTLMAVVALKRADFGFAFGGGAEIILNTDETLRLDIGLRAYRGFLNINNETQTENGTYNVMVKSTRKTNSAYIGISFLF